MSEGSIRGERLTMGDLSTAKTIETANGDQIDSSLQEMLGDGRMGAENLKGRTQQRKEETSAVKTTEIAGGGAKPFITSSYGAATFTMATKVPQRFVIVIALAGISSKPTVLVAEKLGAAGLDLLKEFANVDCSYNLTPEELCTKISLCDALIVRSGTKVSREVFESTGGRLKVVGRAGVGIDNVDLAAATEFGCLVVNAPTANTVAAAEHGIALLAAMARNVAQADASVKAGKWQRNKYVGVSLVGKTLAVMGFGKVGSEVARRAKGLGMHVIAHDPNAPADRARAIGVELVSFDEALATADFISLHMPLTPATSKMLNDETFARMKKGVRIVNVAGGGVGGDWTDSLLSEQLGEVQMGTENLRGDNVDAVRLLGTVRQLEWPVLNGIDPVLWLIELAQGVDDRNVVLKLARDRDKSHQVIEVASRLSELETTLDVEIQEVLERGTFDSSSQVCIIFYVMDAAESPPTYFRTNHFTSPYQEIVDAYGVARYQEANPAVYAVITFPFLFAVMLGDWGQGICLLLGALVLIARERRLSNQKLGSFMEMLFGGRYVFLLMSLFSIYCGLTYDEFFSVPFQIFGGSAYKCREVTCSDAHTAGLVKYRDPYPFGVKPHWRGTRSELSFLNSLKMKMSILFGVAQTNFGIILSYHTIMYRLQP